MQYIKLDANNMIISTTSKVEESRLEEFIEVEENVDVLGKIYLNGAFIEKDKTPEELKQEKLKQVKEKSNNDYQTFISKYPDVEQKSFEKKAEEAYKVSADRTLALSETRYLTDLTGGIENSTIELRNALADAVSAKTIAMAQLETWGVLKRDEIANCTTIDELNQITI